MNNLPIKALTAQIVLYFTQEQGESAELISISEHFQTQQLDKIERKVSS